MRKKIGLMALVLVLVAVPVVVFGTNSAFAQEPVVSDGEAWEEMYQACENGDYEAMAQWHAQCHGQGNVTNGDNVTNGGTVSGGMMGNGTIGSGMMGGGMMGNGTIGSGMMGGGMIGGGMMGNW